MAEGNFQGKGCQKLELLGKTGTVHGKRSFENPTNGGKKKKKAQRPLWRKKGLSSELLGKGPSKGEEPFSGKGRDKHKRMENSRDRRKPPGKEPLPHTERNPVTPASVKEKNLVRGGAFRGRCPERG